MTKQKMIACLALLMVSGVGMAASASAETFIWPVPSCGTITSSYGYRGTSGYIHSGIDISCGANVPILASAKGYVSSRTTSSGQCTYSPSAGTCPICDNSSGNSITLTHDSGMRSAYLHLKQFSVSTATGTQVACGQQVGVMGTTGCSTGNHLHFMIYKGSTYNTHTNPLNYVKYGQNTCPVTCTASTEVCDGKDNDCDGKVDEDGVCEPGYEPMYQSMMYDPQNTDINGDGVADVCGRGAAGVYCSLSHGKTLGEAAVLLNLSDEHGWNDVSNYATIRFADVNGDGKSDLCARANVGVMCWLSEGDTFKQAAIETIPMSDDDGYNDVKYYSTIRFADINGDGKDDFCARFKEGFRCYPSTGTGWGAPIELGDMADSTGWGNPEYYSTIRTADINGDGKVDVCARGGAGFRCWISKANSFEPDFVATAWSDANGWNHPQYYSTIRMPDLNGDGKADLCARDNSGLACHLSDGINFDVGFRGPNLRDDQGWADYSNYATMHFGDINGDGKDDFCIHPNANMTCWLSNGNGFGQGYSIADFSDDSGWNKPEYFRTIRLADVNGDKKKEVCGRFPDGIRCYVFTGDGFDPNPIHVSNFTDNGGWATDPKYYSTIRIGGPLVKPCSRQEEICDGIDNNCNGEVDEGNVCCVPSEEICDGKDNDCDGEIDEGDVCKPACEPSEEICDGKDNDCDGEIDEGNVCDRPEPENPDTGDSDKGDNKDEGDKTVDVPDDCEPSPEVCDGVDNDCDGKVDEDGVCDDVCDPNEEDCEDDGDFSVKTSVDDCSSAPELPYKRPFGLLFAIGGLLTALGLRRRRVSRS